MVPNSIIKQKLLHFRSPRTHAHIVVAEVSKNFAYDHQNFRIKFACLVCLAVAEALAELPEKLLKSLMIIVDISQPW